jgi:hypothetical protein
MKLALFSPYGLTHSEAGLLYLVANYLLKSGADVTQLRCDGAFAVCGRDVKVGEGRNVMSCARCIGEQRALAHWASCKSKEISSFLVADDVLQSAKWLSWVSTADLLRAEFRGVNLWNVCAEEFTSRYPESSITELSMREEECLRQLYIAYVHATVASERFIAGTAPSLHFVAGRLDPVSRAYLTQAQAGNGDVAIFFYDSMEEAIIVESVRTGARYATKLLLNGITSMRNDPRTWAPEVTAIVHEILTFLGFAPERVS